jgi:hypothetical protein
VLKLQYGDDVCVHVKAFGQLIDDWDDSLICEDALMRLFSWTLLMDDGYVGHWFLLHEDNEIKTIRDFLHDFLERFGDDQDEIYVELVDDFMDKWKRKNLLAIKTTNSDREVDSPPNPSEDLKEVIHNMQFSHEKQYEAMNKQFMAMEEQLEIMEGEFTETYIEYPDPLELELDNEKDKGRKSMILDWFFLAKSFKLIKLGKGSSVSHPGQGCFRHLWLHFIQCMNGCNVSLTLRFYFSFVFFHLLGDYVLRIIYVS